MKHLFFSTLLSFNLIFFFQIQLHAQVSESCDCVVDTTGYAAFIQTLNPDENATFQFHVNGTFAVAYGLIGSTTPSVVQDLIDNHSSVTTIIMHSCPGSEDDDANLQASQLIYNQGYKMYLPQGGFIASGATDMFLAGSIRKLEVTVDPVGVHSWSDGVNEATDFAVGHANHLPYINYYVNIGFTQQEAEDFYYYTINAAPTNGIHWMTEAEIDQYKVRSCRYAQNPEYSVSQTGNTLKADLMGATYQWIDCSTNSAIMDSTARVLTPSENGDYAVLITESGCADTSDCIPLTLTSIPKNVDDVLATIQVSPNPVSRFGTIFIDLDKGHTSVKVTMSDLMGRTLYDWEYQGVQYIQTRVEAKPGIYVLRINVDGASKIVRLVLE